MSINILLDKTENFCSCLPRWLFILKGILLKPIDKINLCLYYNHGHQFNTDYLLFFCLSSHSFQASCDSIAISKENVLTSYILTILPTLTLTAKTYIHWEGLSSFSSYFIGKRKFYCIDSYHKLLFV